MKIKCPTCQSDEIVKNGKIHNGKQNHKCKRCNRQFVNNSTKKYISDETKDLVNKLLLERISLAGIARVTGVSETWLQQYVNRLYESVPQEIEEPVAEETAEPEEEEQKKRLKFNVTKCGLLLAKKATNNGSGLLLKY